MSTIDQAQISTELAGLGLRRGHNVLIHSSLSSLGRVAGGAPAVVRALLDVVGDEGTVLAPTLTGNEHIGPNTRLVFDTAGSVCWTGRIAETVRVWPAAVRSLHPTHSVAAVGAAAMRLTEGHEDCVSPCGPGSPYARLAADPDGVILLLGCDHESNTSLHHAEELAGAAYHLQPVPVRAEIRHADRTELRDYRLHRYGTRRDFSRLEPLLVERKLQYAGRVGAAPARLVPAGPMVSLAVEALRSSPEFFVASS